MKRVGTILLALAWSASSGSNSSVQPGGAIDAHVMIERGVLATCIVVAVKDVSGLATGAELAETRVPHVAVKDDYQVAIFQSGKVNLPDNIILEARATVPAAGGTGGCADPLTDSGPMDRQPVTFLTGQVVPVDLSLTTP